MRVRFDMSHIDLAKDDPSTVDLSHIPDWLEPQIRDLLRNMDYANKKTGQVINIKEHMIVDIPKPAEGEEWKVDLGGGEIVEEEE